MAVIVMAVVLVASYVSVVIGALLLSVPVGLIVGGCLAPLLAYLLLPDQPVEAES